jgi:hypothetical protein
VGGCKRGAIQDFQLLLVHTMVFAGKSSCTFRFVFLNILPETNSLASKYPHNGAPAVTHLLFNVQALRFGKKERKVSSIINTKLPVSQGSHFCYIIFAQRCL